MKEKILFVVILICSAVLFISSITGCEAPSSKIPPELPEFQGFTRSFPTAEVQSQKGVEASDIFINIANTLFGMIDSLTDIATGPVRAGTSWGWTSKTSDGTFEISAILAPKGYYWNIKIDGIFDPFGTFHNSTGLDGTSNFDKTFYSFKTYDPQGNKVTEVEYSNDAGNLTLDTKTYSFDIGITFEVRLLIEEENDGTGKVRAYWDNNHVWDESSRFLDLTWWNDQQNGSWETFYNPEVPSFLNITDETGSW